MDTLNYEQWLDDFETFRFNQDLLEFQFSLRKVNEKIKIKTDASSDLKPHLLQLIEGIILQSNLYAITSLSPKDIEKEDMEVFYQEWLDYYMKHMESFLRILFKNGIESFMNMIFQSQRMHELGYHLKHTWPEINDSSEIIWNGSNGYHYDANSAWCKKSEQGTMIRPDGCIAWKDLLSISK